jgi:hypothetical protein
MSDASRLGWAGFVAACATSELDKPVAAWQLRPVAFFGGVFTTAELAWSIPEKGVVAQVRAVQKAQHIVDRPQPFFAIVDALAMVKIAKLGDAAAAKANHVRAGRIQRWAAFLSKFNAIVVQCPGELNFAADYISRHVAPSAQGEEALAAGRAPRPDATATVPEVNNNEITSDDNENEFDDNEGDDAQLGDAKDTAGDLYDYRKARVTPLDWPAYKWPSVTELATAQETALAGQDAQGVDLTQVPDELRKWVKDDIVLGAQTLVNGRAAHKGDNGLWCVDGRIWIPAARLDLHARLS